MVLPREHLPASNAEEIQAGYRLQVSIGTGAREGQGSGVCEGGSDADYQGGFGGGGCQRVDVQCVCVWGGGGVSKSGCTVCCACGWWSGPGQHSQDNTVLCLRVVVRPRTTQHGRWLVQPCRRCVAGCRHEVWTLVVGCSNQIQHAPLILVTFGFLHSFLVDWVSTCPNHSCRRLRSSCGSPSQAAPRTTSHHPSLNFLILSRGFAFMQLPHQ